MLWHYRFFNNCFNNHHGRHTDVRDAWLVGDWTTAEPWKPQSLQVRSTGHKYGADGETEVGLSLWL